MARTRVEALHHHHHLVVPIVDDVGHEALAEPAAHGVLPGSDASDDAAVVECPGRAGQRPVRAVAADVGSTERPSLLLRQLGDHDVHRHGACADLDAHLDGLPLLVLVAGPLGCLTASRSRCVITAAASPGTVVGSSPSLDEVDVAVPQAARPRGIDIARRARAAKVTMVTPQFAGDPSLHKATGCRMSARTQSQWPDGEANSGPLRALVTQVSALGCCGDLMHAAIGVGVWSWGAGDADAEAGSSLDGVVGVVGEGVVSSADEDAVGEVGLAVAAPGLEVVGVAHGGGAVASFGGAAEALPDRHRDPLGFGVQPAHAAVVEDLALPAEDDGDEAGVARHPPRLTGVEAGAGVHGRRTRAHPGGSPAGW